MTISFASGFTAAGPEPEASVAAPTPGSPVLLVTEIGSALEVFSGSAAAVTSVISIRRVSGLATRLHLQAQSSHKSARFETGARKVPS